jgi:hypothetical protein
MGTNPAGEAKHKDRPLVFFDDLGEGRAFVAEQKPRRVECGAAIEQGADKITGRWTCPFRRGQVSSLPPSRLTRFSPVNAFGGPN